MWGFLRPNAPPLLLWGHSTFGAMLAVQIAHAIRRREEAKQCRMGPYYTPHTHGPIPARLIVSGAPPIHVRTLTHRDRHTQREGERVDHASV